MQKDDIVVITKSDHNWNSSMNKWVGNIFRYTGSPGHAAFEDMPSGMSTWYWDYRSDHFRLADDAEKVKFFSKLPLPRKGDLVRLEIDDGWSYSMKSRFLHKVGTVIEVRDGYFIHSEGDGYSFRGYTKVSSLPTPYQGFNLGDTFTVQGILFTIDVDTSGPQPYYLRSEESYDSDKMFSHVADKYKYQKAVLGYIDEEEYDLPQCASIQDLIIFYRAVNERKTFGEESIIHSLSSHYDLGDIVTIRGCRGYIKEAGKYYWNCTEGANDKPFRGLSITATELQFKTLGYSDPTGNFPFCKTLSDLTVFIQAIQDYKDVIPESLITPHIGAEEAPLTKNENNSGVPILFINVPKI